MTRSLYLAGLTALGLVATMATFDWTSEAPSEWRQRFDAILLDAEGNLPLEGVTDRKCHPYPSFLNRAHSALKEGGLLAISCAADHKSFERKLRQVGFDVSYEIVASSHKGKQQRRSTIWLARKGSYQPRPSLGDANS